MLNEYERRQLAGIEARLRADSPELFERSGDRGSLRRAGRRLTRWWAVVGLALACAGQLWSSVPMAWLGVLVLSVLALLGSCAICARPWRPAATPTAGRARLPGGDGQR